jgi:3'-phosphoadenosine 5'-phosphosulfate sulfotransferase (PAPS reductase)/FAD synthetase
MKDFYEPAREHLDRLTENWCASYSGGKDSTSLVTWIEWMRRAGWISVETPRLVLSDTGVEYEILREVTADMLALLRASGWECTVVEPRINEKLYNRIFGIGNTPIHAGATRMRWCTRSTKIDPMNRWRKEAGAVVALTGLRWGESKMRDGKLRRAGCGAGGECGIPEPDTMTYSPIINWTTCNVVDWLSGMVERPVRNLMGDVFEITGRLGRAYGIKFGETGFGWEPPEVQTMRFGCIGCPAISATGQAPASAKKHDGHAALLELYALWEEARKPENRLHRANIQRFGGPIRIEARKRLFVKLMDIQRRAGIVLVTPEDEAFIRDCWERKVYPRGWSEADESTPIPAGPLFNVEVANA